MKDEIEKEYKKLQNKYQLPDIKKLEKEFDLKFDKPTSILQDTIDGITNEISDISKMLESLIFVDSGNPPIHLYESKMLSDKDIDTFGLLKELMSTYWTGKRIKIQGNEKEMVSFVKKSMEKWEKNIKPKIIELSEIFETGWKNAKLRELEDNHMSYLG
ncbi:MAG: hypothetical protein J4428_05285 [Candidatus Aenigmarchaeota archaeon]|nr:hypothetical protein [Candidatus Aenigmarchaeota archaeon]